MIISVVSRARSISQMHAADTLRQRYRHTGEGKIGQDTLLARADIVLMLMIVSRHDDRYHRVYINL